MPGPAQKGPLIRYAGSAAETSIDSKPVGDELGGKSIPRAVPVKRTHTGTASLQRSAEHARPRDAVTGDDLPQRARASAPLVHGRGIPPGPAGQTRVLYWVVGGYGGDTLTAKRARSSKRRSGRGLMGGIAKSIVGRGSHINVRRPANGAPPDPKVSPNSQSSRWISPGWRTWTSQPGSLRTSSREH